jgi:hypothetical protein
MKETKHLTHFWLENSVDRDYFVFADTTEKILEKLIVACELGSAGIR